MDKKIRELAHGLNLHRNDHTTDQRESALISFYNLARADLLADNTHLQGEVISLRSENMRLREALSQLEIYAEESNNACYGTVSANLILDIVRAALGQTK